MARITTLEEAARSIPDGARVGVGGVLMDRRPIALLAAMVRAGVRDMTVSSFLASLDVEILLAGGCVRRVRTEVTIWDGATVVMGGLTREQAVTVDDKVPVLGDIPLLGRLFQSKGESSEKRNLLIFVSANLISPGGSPQRQEFRTVEPGSLFQNPTIVTPGGGVNRGLNERSE